MNNWIVQEFIESPPYLFQLGEDGYAEHYAVWGFIFFGETYAGGVLRIAPADNETGIINNLQGARVSVIFEVDEEEEPPLRLKGNYIGILAKDNPELYAGLLGILKSGNTFVPINPVFPEERIRFIIEDLQIPVLLTDAANIEKARQIAASGTSIRRILYIEDAAADTLKYEVITIAGRKESAGGNSDCEPVYEPP
ncbi:MAG: amino acid adenylation domain-containing protein, partial [bacterium]|nr:amino acid adenylation domain-containing protein [bacterium]